MDPGFRKKSRKKMSRGRRDGGRPHGGRTFTEFGGTASGSGIPEEHPRRGPRGCRRRHGILRFSREKSVGLGTRIMPTWTKILVGLEQGLVHPHEPGSNGLLEPDADFFDENKVWRSIKASQVLTHDTQLRFTPMARRVLG